MSRINALLLLSLFLSTTAYAEQQPPTGDSETSPGEPPETISDSAPAEETPVEETPVEEAPAEEAPVEETPTALSPDETRETTEALSAQPSQAEFPAETPTVAPTTTTDSAPESSDSAETAVLPEPSEDPVPQRYVRPLIGGIFLTLAHFRNDSDFDPSERYYDSDGQSIGQVATFFRPILGLAIGDHLQIVYEAELGWNVWSRNDPGQPNQFFPLNQPGLNLRHRQLWASYRPRPTIDLRIGYQHLSDPSRLFLDHYGGVLSVALDWRGGTTNIIIGQLPDSTYEGVELTGDNFVTDSVVGGVQHSWSSGAATIDAALYGIGDFRLIDRPLALSTLVVGGRYQWEHLEIWAYLLAQVGSWKNSGVNGEDQLLLSFAAQAGLAYHLEDFRLAVNVHSLSPDDDNHGNNRIGAFFASAKNNSATLLLTEDEFRDRYDNYDERIATAWGPFFVNRAGLFIADVSASYRVTSWYEPRLVLGVGVNLNSTNALDNTFVGFEADLINTFALGDHVALFLICQLLVPGKGSAVFVNDVDRQATQILWGGEAGFMATF